MSEILKKLNEQQQVAASQIDGQILILAGAGSGKTRTITYRIAHMIKEKNIKPFNILAVTFTNKAAKEMKERVANLIGYEANMVTIATFHAFGMKLLRQYAEQISYLKNFTIYDRDDQKKLIKNILKSYFDKEKIEASFLNEVISRISNLKEYNISPEVYENQEKNIAVVAKTYKIYNEELKKNNAMDFSDILLNTLKLLEIPEILEKVQDKYKYIMVDEYQDTNSIQYNIIKKIAQKFKNICVVGDENQSIYAFRGADISNILNFEKDYPNAKVIKLEENYRSTPTILNAANEVIKNNSSSKDKKLWSRKKDGDKIKILEAFSAYNEADLIVDKIKELTLRGYSYKDFSILYRTNAQSRIIENIFMNRNIKYKIFGGLSFYARVEIKDVLAYLSVIVNENDEINLLRILNVPRRGIGEASEEKILEYAKKSFTPLYHILKNIDVVDNLTTRVKNQIKTLVEILENAKKLKEELTASEITKYLLKEIDYELYLKNEYDNPVERYENVKELLNSMYEIEKMLNTRVDLASYLEHISLNSAIDNLSEEENCVKMMTLHNSKGLEFPVVFLSGFEQGVFPKYNVDLDELEEERRLLYVGITRAEEKLFLTYAKERILYGREAESREVSQFLSEIPDNLIEKSKDFNNINSKTFNNKQNIIDNIPRKNIITLDDLKNTKCNFKKGDRILHKKFGLGLILNVDSKKITISFVDGQRDLSVNLADKFLKKID